MFFYTSVEKQIENEPPVHWHTGLDSTASVKRKEIIYRGCM